MDVGNNLTTAQKLKNAQNEASFLLKFCWGVIIMLFVIPNFVFAPMSASSAEHNLRIEMSTKGVPTGYAPGYGKYSSKVATAFRPPLAGEADILAKQEYDTTLGNARFFLSFVAFMVFLTLQTIWFRPANARQRAIVNQLQQEYDAELGSQQETYSPENLFDERLNKI